MSDLPLQVPCGIDGRAVFRIHDVNRLDFYSFLRLGFRE
jgi:hypothetical protein